jgi:hypothetical protein
MSLEATTKYLAKQLLATHTVAFESETLISVDGVSYKVSAFDKFLTTEKVANFLKPKPELFVTYHGLGQHKDFVTTLARKLVGKLKRDRQGETSDKTLGSFDYQNLCLIYDVETADYQFYDKGKKACIPLHMDTWKMMTSKDEKELTQKIAGKVYYNPKKNTGLYRGTFASQEVMFANRYIEPEWMKIPAYSGCPAEFTEFMDYLIIDDGCREFVYFWLKEMLQERCSNILLLNANMGTGKGTFTKIVQRLVGDSNFFSTSQDFFNSRFNGELDGRKAIVFDEIEIKGAAKNTLKNIANDKVAIEKKGRELLYKDNHASIIVTNNHASSCKLVPSDRRFHAVDVTDVPMKEVFTPEQMLKLNDLIDTDEFISNIGYWLKEKVKGKRDWTPAFTWKGAKFQYLCELSLTDWQRYLIECLKNARQSEMEISEIKENYRVENGDHARFGGETKISELLREYLDESGQTYGAVYKKNGYPTIKVNPKYVTADEEDFDI